MTKFPKFAEPPRKVWRKGICNNLHAIGWWHLNTGNKRRLSPDSPLACGISVERAAQENFDSNQKGQMTH